MGAPHSFSGLHVMAELIGVDRELSDDEVFLRRTLTGALREAGATVCGVLSRHFAPQGVTVLALLAESHASIHTYPESGRAFLDVFTCGDRARPELAVKLVAGLMGGEVEIEQVVKRGVTAR